MGILYVVCRLLVDIATPSIGRHYSTSAQDIASRTRNYKNCVYSQAVTRMHPFTSLYNATLLVFGIIDATSILSTSVALTDEVFLGVEININVHATLRLREFLQRPCSTSPSRRLLLLLPQ